MKNQSFILLFAIFCLAVSVNLRKEKDCIKLYSECNFQGECVTICENNPSIKLKFAIKSIYIPEGYSFAYYNKSNYKGPKQIYSSSQSCLDSENPQKPVQSPALDSGDATKTNAQPAPKQQPAPSQQAKQPTLQADSSNDSPPSETPSSDSPTTTATETSESKDQASSSAGDSSSPSSETETKQAPASNTDSSPSSQAPVTPQEEENKQTQPAASPESQPKTDAVSSQPTTTTGTDSSSETPSTTATNTDANPASTEASATSPSSQTPSSSSETGAQPTSTEGSSSSTSSETSAQPSTTTTEQKPAADTSSSSSDATTSSDPAATNNEQTTGSSSDASTASSSGSETPSPTTTEEGKPASSDGTASSTSSSSSSTDSSSSSSTEADAAATTSDSTNPTGEQDTPQTQAAGTAENSQPQSTTNDPQQVEEKADEDSSNDNEADEDDNEEPAPLPDNNNNESDDESEPAPKAEVVEEIPKGDLDDVKVSDDEPEEVSDTVQEETAKEIPEDVVDTTVVKGEKAEEKDKTEIEKQEKGESDSELKSVKLNENPADEVVALNTPVSYLGKIVSFSSFNYPEKFIRHSSFNGFLQEVKSDLDKKDSSFFVRKSLRGLASAISLESVNYPKHYLVVDSSTKRLVLKKFENKAGYKQLASFFLKDGLAQGICVSLESTKFRNNFIRHRNFETWLDKFDKKDQFKQDATFTVTKGNFIASNFPVSTKILIQHERYQKFIRPRNSGKMILQKFNKFASQREEFYLINQGKGKFCIKYYDNLNFLGRAANQFARRKAACQPVTLVYLPSDTKIKNQNVRQALIKLDKYYMQCFVRCWFKEKNVKKAHTFNLIEVSQFSRTVTFKTPDGYYLSADNEGGKGLLAVKKSPKDAEKFTLIPQPNGKYCLRANNSKYFVGLTKKNKDFDAKFTSCQPVRLVYLKNQKTETQVQLLFKKKRYMCYNNKDFKPETKFNKDCTTLIMDEI